MLSWLLSATENEGRQRFRSWVKKGLRIANILLLQPLTDCLARLLERFEMLSYPQVFQTSQAPSRLGQGSPITLTKSGYSCQTVSQELAGLVIASHRGDKDRAPIPTANPAANMSRWDEWSSFREAPVKLPRELGKWELTSLPRPS
jgi:hypothetical protein